MRGFPQAVSDVQTLMRDLAVDDMAYVVDVERQREAESVAPCAARFVEGEMDPTGRLTVARGVDDLPSLAAKLGGKLARRDEEDRAAVAYAVHKALAVGYLGHCEIEESADIGMRLNRKTEDIWEYWVATCRTGLEALGIPADLATMVRRMDADLFVGELRALKLMRYLGEFRLSQLGLLYSRAGVNLRIAQADSLPGEVFEREVRIRRERPDRPWRWEDYSPVD